jgi:hypothetical protein
MRAFSFLGKKYFGVSWLKLLRPFFSFGKFMATTKGSERKIFVLVGSGIQDVHHGSATLI